MKKIILIIIALIVVVIGIIIGVNELTKRTVHFILPEGKYTVDIYSGENKITNLSASGDVRLHDGIYAYRVIGDHYKDASSSFTVKAGENIITISPTYTDEYLTTLLDIERDPITTTISNTYKTPQDYNTVIKLRNLGEWAIAALTPTPVRGQLSDTFYSVLHKEDSVWKIIAPPQLTINAKAYPNIPKSILYDIYSVSL